MKAYEVRDTTGLDGLVLNNARAEPQPGHGQILVRMRAAALNYRDQGVIKGVYGYTKFPVIPLSDGAGEVTAVGPGVTQFKPGDRVTSTFFVNWTGGRIRRMHRGIRSAAWSTACWRITRCLTRPVRSKFPIT
jgi:NADPH:quinone reductase-like Zn-dependent oxidoreductase